VLLYSYVNKLPTPVMKLSETILQTFLYILHPLIEYTRKRCRIPIPTTENEFTNTAINYFDCFMLEWR
jgi:hypothetical protein